MKAIFATLALIALIAPSTSHALVIETTSCTTFDNSLAVAVVDNQGTGFDRSSNMTAYIQDANDNTIATIPVQVLVQASSASFGRPTYIDIATHGQTLTLQGPSTNFHNYVMMLKTQARTVSDTNLNCARFMGQMYAQ